MEQKISWTVTEASGKVTRQGSKMAHKAPFIPDEKTTKGQKTVIDGWNEMQQCLIDNGLMETK